MITIALVALGIWFLVSIVFVFFFMVWVNLNRGQCAFHGFNRRLVIDTDCWEYFECSVCGAREAEEIYGAAEYQPLNRQWLNGGRWC